MKTKLNLFLSILMAITLLPIIDTERNQTHISKENS